MSKLNELKRLVKNKTGSASNATSVVGALKEVVADVTSTASNATTIEGAIKELADYYAPTVATPTATPAAGEVASGTEIELACATAGVTIYYTTNGDTPTTSSTKYTAKIAISEAATIKAISVKAGMKNSAVLTAAYTIAG